MGFWKQGNRGGKCNFSGEQANKENVGEHGTQENKFSIFGEQASLFQPPPHPPPPVRASMVSG